ncbi:hypothetical protein KM043_006175 [Ampulex compressa]|nr:hypothetical protein KM043_006175 [Ampulex compressa]
MPFGPSCRTREGFPAPLFRPAWISGPSCAPFHGQLLRSVERTPFRYTIAPIPIAKGAIEDRGQDDAWFYVLHCGAAQRRRKKVAAPREPEYLDESEPRASVPRVAASCRAYAMKIFWVLFALILSNSVADLPTECNDPNWHTLETAESSRLECGTAFKNRCYCHRTCYDGHHQYVVNCTNSGFHNAVPLANLPNETQVLIFTGNELEELPWNVFGTLDSLPYLRVIDMSNNKIREIRGKAYHHVQHVTRLVLDFNELSLDPEKSHPRVFSNFVSLRELHLTDAFEDGPPRDLAATLHNIFVNSNLTQLIKLHLEQNEISEFRDANVFCDLPDLTDLHLGDNALTALHFNLSCIRNLRFLDLQRNKFTKVLERDLRSMDALARHDRSLTVDFSGNPLECNCKLNPLLEWMERTKVFVRNKGNLRCYEDGVRREEELRETKNCPPKLFLPGRRATTALLCFLSLLLVALVCALLYVQRLKLGKRFEPVLDFVGKRVRYTSIATGDNREDV